mmetsp:Transcript_58993/g.157746  ORF Transcript_58993/g.157746 Transcript_58993/m.157746 type:complete len:80 (+) Transcript_58993:985-1224(+)
MTAQHRSSRSWGEMQFGWWIAGGLLVEVGGSGKNKRATTEFGVGQRQNFAALFRRVFRESFFLSSAAGPHQSMLFLRLP